MLTFKYEDKLEELNLTFIFNLHNIFLAKICFKEKWFLTVLQIKSVKPNDPINQNVQVKKNYK